MGLVNLPINDWECSACGHQILDRYQPRLDTTPPPCPHPDIQNDGEPLKRHEMQRLWTTSNDVKFREFDADIPGLGTHHISDIHQLRRLEKQAASIGRPWAIRQYTNDSSNRDRNTFRHLQPDQRVRKYNRRGRPVITAGHGEGDS